MIGDILDWLRAALRSVLCAALDHRFEAVRCYDSDGGFRIVYQCDRCGEES